MQAGIPRPCKRAAPLGCLHIWDLWKVEQLAKQERSCSHPGWLLENCSVEPKHSKMLFLYFVAEQVDIKGDHESLVLGIMQHIKKTISSLISKRNKKKICSILMLKNWGSDLLKAMGTFIGDLETELGHFDSRPV